MPVQTSSTLKATPHAANPCSHEIETPSDCAKMARSESRKHFPGAAAWVITCGSQDSTCAEQQWPCGASCSSASWLFQSMENSRATQVASWAASFRENHTWQCLCTSMLVF